MPHSSTAQPREVLYIMDPPKPPTNRVGTAGFVVSILGIFTFGFLSPLGLLLSFLGLFKKPRGFAMIGTLLSLTGTAFLVGMAALPAMVHHRHIEAARLHAAEAETESAIKAAVERLQLMMDDPTVESIDGYSGNAVTIQFVDAWGKELRFDERSNGFAVRSAGADSQFDTSDDLVRVISQVRISSRTPGEFSL